MAILFKRYFRVVICSRRNFTCALLALNFCVGIYIYSHSYSANVLEKHWNEYLRSFIVSNNISNQSIKIPPPLNSQEMKIYPDLWNCPSRSLKPFYYQKGDFWILENYILAEESFKCDESITYTTHSDFTFFHNLEPLVSRWQGPVSLSVFAPSTDFQRSLEIAIYYRECRGASIKNFVTFHFFFPVLHFPEKVPSLVEIQQMKANCSNSTFSTEDLTYRQENSILYPVNIARNVARMAAQTYFVLPSDIELYPSVNFIPEFLKMLRKPDASSTMNPRVYVFPLFEVKESVAPPETKTQLIPMLRSKKAIPFHQFVCSQCHKIPYLNNWIKATIRSELSIFNIAKRRKPYNFWEPIYVGTNKEPLYDERLSWEGKSDKMTQMYILCVMEYEFHILDNAFLVHRSGIKRYRNDPKRNVIVNQQNRLIKKNYNQQYYTLFSRNKNCD